MALLDMMGQGPQGAGGQIDPMQLLQMLQMSQKDPFTKSMPGDALLGPGGMTSPDSMSGLPHPDMQQNGAQGPMMNHVSTDFADTQPGLPNLPDTFKGFGFGQFAPEVHQPGIRQQLIQQLMKNLSMGQSSDVGGVGMGGF